MQNKTILALSLWLLFLPGLGSAQPLAELLTTARSNNPELQALHQEYLAALEKGPQVSQLPNTDIGVGAFIAPVETRLGAQQVRIGVAQMFPWFGTLAAREAVVLTQARASYERVASKALDLEFRLKAAYFKLYEIRTAQEILRRNLRILEALRQLALAKVESGKATAADVLRVDLKLQELEQELRILANEEVKPLADLNQLLNRSSATPVTVQDTFGFAALPYQRDTLRAHLRQYHPALRMFTLQQEASRRALELNELEGRPSLGVGLDYIMVGPRTDATPLNNGRDIFQLSAKVSIPLWREKYQAREREENLRVAALENYKADAESRFLATIDQAFADHETARLRQELYDRQITTTTTAIRILRTNYSATGDSFDELLRLESELVAYDRKILSAIVQSQLARAAIERYLTL